MNFSELRALIETNVNHATTSDADMVAWLNEQVVVRDKTSLPAKDIMDTILSNTSEWLALTADQKQIVDMILTHSDPVPTVAGSRPRAVLTAVLGTNTKQDLAAKIPETVSRAVGAGINETIAEGLVAYARTF